MSEETIAQRVRARRLAEGYSQEGLARAANVSLSTIVRFENGRLPTVDRLRRIAAALDFTLDEIVEGNVA